MHTQADEKRDQALDAVHTAIKLLSEIVIGECSGHDHYNDEYQEKLRTALVTLIEVRSDLKVN